MWRTRRVWCVVIAKWRDTGLEKELYDIHSELQAWQWIDTRPCTSLPSFPLEFSTCVCVCVDLGSLGRGPSLWRRLGSTRNCILDGRCLQAHSPYFRVCLARQRLHDRASVWNFTRFLRESGPRILRSILSDVHVPLASGSLPGVLVA